MNATNVPGKSLDAIARRLMDLRKLARLERKELGAVSVRTRSLIREELALAEAACAIHDMAKATTQRKAA